MEPRPPLVQISPLMRASIEALVISIESAVTRQGPIDVAKSLPNAGPMPTDISRNCISRALQSLKMVYPTMASSACSGVASKSGLLITAAISSS